MITNVYVEDWWKPTGKMQEPTSGIVKVREYRSPFEYANVKVWNPEGVPGVGPHPHGYEMARNEGMITITEPEPIIAVSVIGSGCIAPGYVICEYLLEGQSTEEADSMGPWRGYNMQNIRMQRIGDLMRFHPCKLMRARDYQEIVQGYEPRSPTNELLIGENTAYFEIEPAHRVVLRGGSGDHDHFSFRIIRTYVMME
jgi:hypothetical protein